MNKFNMFITAVCVLFLIKLRWPKNKSIYDIVERKRKLISASTGCNRTYPYMALQEVVLGLRARGQKQNGALALKF